MSEPFTKIKPSPPHNVEAEQQLLGAILCEASNFDKVQSKLYPNDFYKETYQKIFQALLDLDEAGDQLKSEIRQNRERDFLGIDPGFDPDAGLLLFTEGEKKSLKTMQEGPNCAGLGGIWNFAIKDDGANEEVMTKK
jgi:hypothetical protein